MTVFAFIRLTRPLFLAGGALLYALGVLVAYMDGATLSLGRLLAGQFLVTTIQLMTHYANEYYDQECDRLNTNRTWFSGGSGVLVAGTLSPRVAQRAMFVLALAALVALVAAGLLAPWVVLPGLLALALAWSYSGPPLVLARTGLGEGVASLIVALLVPVVGYGMQTNQVGSPLLWVVCAPLVLIHFAMLIAFQIPDRPSDAQAGKHTLAVRLGEAASAQVHNFSLFLAFCVIFMLAFLQTPGAWLAGFGFPLAVWQTHHLRRVLAGAETLGRFSRYGLLTLGAVGLFAITAALWLAGLSLNPAFVAAR